MSFFFLLCKHVCTFFFPSFYRLLSLSFPHFLLSLLYFISHSLFKCYFLSSFSFLLHLSSVLTLFPPPAIFHFTSFYSFSPPLCLSASSIISFVSILPFLYSFHPSHFTSISRFQFIYISPLFPLLLLSSSVLPIFFLIPPPPFLCRNQWLFSQ